MSNAAKIYEWVLEKVHDIEKKKFLLKVKHKLYDYTCVRRKTSL